MDALDRIDAQIIRALENDARRSNKELAAEVGLAPSSCLERVRRLIEKKVLKSFHAEVDRRALGASIEAMVTLRLRRHSRRRYQALRAHILSRPEVLSVFHVSGRDDFLVHVAVRDTGHLHDLCIDHFSSRDEVGTMETSLIFEHMRASESPSYLEAPEPRARG